MQITSNCFWNVSKNARLFCIMLHFSRLQSVLELKESVATPSSLRMNSALYINPVWLRSSFSASLRNIERTITAYFASSVRLIFFSVLLVGIFLRWKRATLAIMVIS